MMMTIDIPEKALAEATLRVIPVERVIRGKFELPQASLSSFVNLGSPTMSPVEAVARIRDLQKRYTLGDVTIQDLIEEGRRH